MSTLAYAALTSRREEATPGTSSSTSSPGVKNYVDVFAALVPAEVLTAHAVVLSFTTVTQKNQIGDVVTTITEPTTLKWVFVALLLLSMGLYVVGHRTHWDRLDFVRMLIPPLAFVGWTMLQKTTAFDALGLNMGDASRSAIALIGAIVLGAVVGLLAYRADQQSPAADQSVPGANQPVGALDGGQ